MLEERWYQARQYAPGVLLRCEHGLDPACECVLRYDIDKNSPLIKKQRIATAAKYEQNRMERLNEHDEQKFRLLTQISQCEDNVETIYDNEYETSYGSLTPSLPREPPQKKTSNIFPTVLIILAILLMIVLLIMVNTNT